MKKNLFILLTIPLFLCINSPSRADLISYNASQLAEGYLAFPLFDPSLGTLNSILIRPSSDYQMNIILANVSSLSHVLNITSYVSLIDRTGNIQMDYSGSTSIPFIGRDVTISFMEPITIIPLTFFDQDILTAFSGLATIDMLAFGNGCWAFDGGAVTCENIPMGHIWASIAYDYTPDQGPSSLVPEPSTMLLLGSGLVGLMGYGRKRMKK